MRTRSCVRKRMPVRGPFGSRSSVLAGPKKRSFQASLLGHPTVHTGYQPGSSELRYRKHLSLSRGHPIKSPVRRGIAQPWMRSADPTSRRHNKLQLLPFPHYLLFPTYPMSRRWTLRSTCSPYQNSEQHLLSQSRQCWHCKTVLQLLNCPTRIQGLLDQAVRHMARWQDVDAPRRT